MSLHDAMHRLPGFPGHETAAERNSNRSGRIRAARWNTAGNARAQRLNTATNEAGAVRAARWNSNAHAERNHIKPPRMLAGLQEYIARRVGRGE